MEGPVFWGLATTAAFFIGLSKGGAPLMSVLAVPIMSMTLSPVAAAGLLLPVLLFADVMGMIAYRRAVHWPMLRLAAIGFVVGTGLGWATAHLVSDDAVRLLLGVIGLVFGISFLRRPSRSVNISAPAGSRQKAAGLFWTSVAGFTSFVSHSGAPPWQVWALPQGLPKMVFAGTSTFAFAVMNVLKIGPYWALGQFNLGGLWVTVILFAPAAIGVILAYLLIRRVPDAIFFGFVTWALLAISAKLLWDGASGLI